MYPRFVPQTGDPSWPYPVGMETFVRNFVRSSLVWLGVTGLLGLSMAFWPGEHLVYRPAHAHAALLGFVSMMIFGVAYHVMPRFAGRPLWSRRMAALHLPLANGGLALMVAGFLARPTWYGPGTLALQIGGTATAVGLAMFIANLWKTLEEPKAARRARKTVLRPGGARAGPGSDGGVRLPMASCPAPGASAGAESGPARRSPT